MTTSFKLSMQLGASLGSSVRQSFQETEGRLNRLGSTIGRLKDQQKSIRKFSMNTTSVEQAKKSLLKARRELAGFNGQLKKNATPTKKLTANIKKAQKNVDRLSQRLDTQQSRLQKTRRELESSGLSTKNLSRDNERLGRSVERLSGKYQRLGKSIAAQREKATRAQEARSQRTARRSELRGQIFDTVAIGAAVVAPLVVAVNFEADVSKLGAITRTSGKELESLSQKARQLGEETLFSASQAVGAMNFLGMAGFTPDKILSATPGILNLAQAAGEDLGRTADVASNILSGFGLEADQMDRLGDVLTATFTRTNTNLSMLGETMKFVAPVAAATGASIEQVAAMAGKLGDAGIQGGRAGTVLRASFLRLAAPTGMAASTLAELGIAVQDEAGNLRAVPAIFEDIAEAVQDLGSAQQAAVVKSVFGEEAASGVTQLLSVVKKGELTSFINELKAADNTAKTVADQMANNSLGAIKRLGSALESVAISVGTTLLPVIEFGANLFARMASGLSKLSQQFPLLTTVVMGAVVGLVALRLVTLGSMFTYNVLASAVGSLGTAYTFLTAKTTLAKVNLIRLNVLSKLTAAWAGIVTAAQWAWNVALTANPIGVVVVAIGALIGAGVLLIKNWDKVKNFFGGLWEGLKNITGKAVGWLLNKIGQLLDPFGVVRAIGRFVFGDDEDTENASNTSPKNTAKRLAKATTLGAVVEETAKPKSLVESSSVTAPKFQIVEPKPFEAEGTLNLRPRIHQRAIVREYDRAQRAVAPVAQSTGGMLARLGDVLDRVALGLGRVVLPVVTLGTAYSVLTNSVSLARLQFLRITALSKLSAAWTGVVTAAQWAWNAALTANPIGLVVVGVGALMGVGVALVKNWDKVKHFFGSMWEGLKTVTGKAVSWLLDKISQLLDPFGVVRAIGSFVFGEDEDENVKDGGRPTTEKINRVSAVLGASLGAATALAAPIATAPLPEFQAAGVTQNTQNVSFDTAVTINATPGMDERAVAQEVERVLDAQRARAEQERRGALFDLS